MAYKKMTVAEWIAVKDNPIQRDTERHATKAKHLLTPHPTHQFVFAAELPNGKLIKLDGHTRALVWKRKDVEPPAFVLAGIIPVPDSAAAERLYKDFDSREALETNTDKVSGAYNRHNFVARSVLLQRGSIMTALKMAYAILNGSAAGTGAGTGQRKSAAPGTKSSELYKADVYTMIDEFSYELHALDGFMLRPGQAGNGVMGAFLVSTRRYGHKVIPFWQGVFANTGDKKGNQMDAIQATVDLIIRRRNTRSGSAASADMCARCLGGVEAWLADRVMTRVPTPIDTAGYLQGHEKPSERLIKAADIAAKKRLKKAA